MRMRHLRADALVAAGKTVDAWLFVASGTALARVTLALKALEGVDTGAGKIARFVEAMVDCGQKFDQCTLFR